MNLWNLFKRNRNNSRPSSEAIKDLFLDNYPMNSAFAESYRTLRTNVQFSFVKEDFRSVLVTSAAEGEGKSSTSANLAFTMARAGKRVLMIDGDLRKPVLSELSSDRKGTGLTGLLSDVFGTTVQSGSLAEFGVSDLLRLLSFQNKTGRLRLSEGVEEIHVYLLLGKIIDLDWLTRPQDKALASTLLREKLVTAEQVKRALARRKATGKKLSTTLVNMGVVQEDDLAGFIIHQLTEGFRFAVQFRSGEFAFEELPQSYFYRSAFTPLDVSKIQDEVVFGGEYLPYLQKRINAAIVETGTANLFILPSGPRPPNPTELLDSHRMSFLLSYLSRQFDRMVIDSPPVLAASDSMALASRADGVIMTIKVGQVNREVLQKAILQFRMAQVNLIGVVLSEVDPKRGGYYRHYRKYYSEYYGDSD